MTTAIGTRIPYSRALDRADTCANDAQEALKHINSDSDWRRTIAIVRAQVDLGRLFVDIAMARGYPPRVEAVPPTD